MVPSGFLEREVTLGQGIPSRLPTHSRIHEWVGIGVSERPEDGRSHGASVVKAVFTSHCVFQ